MREGLPLPGGRLWILFSRHVLSWKLFIPSLDMESAWRLWKIAQTVWRKATDLPLRIRGVSFTFGGTFVARLKTEYMHTAGLVEGRCYDKNIPVERLWGDSQI